MWVSGWLPARIIAHQGRPYMERYYVGTPFGLRIYLHRFVDSDPDGLHDHPWRWSMSLILLGSYLEERAVDVMRMVVEARPVRWVNVITGDTFHRVVLADPVAGQRREVWSLFMHTPRVKGWGFIRLLGNELDEMDYSYHQAGSPPETRFTDWPRTAKRGREIARQP